MEMRHHVVAPRGLLFQNPSGTVYCRGYKRYFFSNPVPSSWTHLGLISLAGAVHKRGTGSEEGVHKFSPQCMFG